MEIELGREILDRVTKLKGIAVSRTTYLNGCVRVGLQPPLDKDGKVQDCFFIDEQQLDYTENVDHVLKQSEEKRGGPMLRGSP